MTGPTRMSTPDLHESVLELRDALIGIQAQLDELDARIARIEDRVGHRGPWRRFRSRMRSAMQRARGSSSTTDEARGTPTEPPPAT